MERTDRAKADIVGYTEEYGQKIRSWIDSEAAWNNLAPGREYPPPENVVQTWQNSAVKAYLLLSENRIVAYGELWDKPQKMAVEIAHLLVDPAHRSQGFGTKMVELLYNRASRRQGVAQVLINLVGSDEDALGCYLKAGFEIIGANPTVMGLRLVRLVE